MTTDVGPVFYTGFGLLSLAGSVCAGAEAPAVKSTSWHLTGFFSILFALYLKYYYTNFGKIPAIFCKQDTRLNAILQRVPILKQAYKPPFWCAESRCQTIVRSFLPCSMNLKWHREVVEANKGGRFYIDWHENETNWRFPDSASRPTVIILPGITSTTESSYINSIAGRLVNRGFRIMVLVYRGLDGMEILTPLTYCATHTVDLAQTVDIFTDRYPEAKLFSVGASLGSLILGRYLSESGEDAKIEAAMLFSCPFDPPICIKELESWSNRWLLNVHITHELKRNYRRHSHVFESVVDHEKVENAQSLRDFDDHFTTPVFGYRTSEEYYADSSLNEKRLQAIKVPMLCVGSNDDAFSPERALPKDSVTRTDHVALVMTYGGGHVSHLHGWNPMAKSYFELIMEEYFDAMIHGD